MDKMDIFCTNCGSRVSSEWKYCRSCGHPVEKSTILTEPIEVKAPTYNAYSEKTNHTNSGTTITILFVLMFLLFIGGGLCVAYFARSYSSSATTIVPTQATSPLMSPPSSTSSLNEEYVYNGKVIVNPSYEGQCPLTVSTPTGSGGYYVYLEYIGEVKNSLESRKAQDFIPPPYISDLAFYISAGESVSIDVPVGTYKFYYAYGEKWYGEKDLFGENTIYYSSDDLLNFYKDSRYYNGHIIELWKQTNGNFDTNMISKNDFPS